MSCQANVSVWIVESERRQVEPPSGMFDELSFDRFNPEDGWLVHSTYLTKAEALRVAGFISDDEKIDVSVIITPPFELMRAEVDLESVAELVALLKSADRSLSTAFEGGVWVDAVLTEWSDWLVRARQHHRERSQVFVEQLLARVPEAEGIVSAHQDHMDGERFFDLVVADLHDLALDAFRSGQGEVSRRALEFVAHAFFWSGDDAVRTAVFVSFFKSYMESDEVDDAKTATFIATWPPTLLDEKARREARTESD